MVSCGDSSQRRTPNPDRAKRGSPPKPDAKAQAKADRYTGDVTAIVFDLDGTLVDSFDDISAAFCRSFHVAGCEPPEADVVRQMIGKPLRDMYAPWVPAETIDALVAEYRRD